MADTNNCQMLGLEKRRINGKLVGLEKKWFSERRK